MADIRKRVGKKGTTYQVRYPNKQTKSGYAFKSFGTLKEARTFSHNIGSERDRTRTHIRTVPQATGLWLDICEKIGRDGRETVEPETLKEYKRRAGVIKEYEWPKELCELEPADIVHFRNWLLKSKSRDLARRTLSSLHSILIEMKHQGHIKSDPATGITIKSGGRYEENDSEVDIPSDQELRDLLAAADSMGQKNHYMEKVWARYRPMIYLAAFTGMRPSEYRGLAWSEIEGDKVIVKQRAAAAKHREERGADTLGPDADSPRKALERKQQKRREYLLKQKNQLEERQAKESRTLASKQQREGQALKDLYRAESRAIRSERETRKPSGLAAFLGRITGVQLVRKKVHVYQDRRRHKRFLELREELAADHQHEKALQEKRHQLQALDFRRHERSLGALDQREKRALELTLLRESRVVEREERKGESRSGVGIDFTKAAQQSLGSVFEQVVAAPSEAGPGIELSKEFAEAAKEEKEEKEEGKQGSSKGPKKKGNSVEEKPKRRRRRRRRRDRDIDRGR